MNKAAHITESTQKGVYFFLTLIRIAIGWHFLHEGIVKLFTPGWTSAEYLLHARGFASPLYEWLASSPTLIAVADFLNIWGLILIGLGLFLGAFTRLFAIGGVLLLALYYFAYIPIGGLDYGVPSEGSYLVVNKNLIELITLLLLAIAPVAKLWGLDRWYSIQRSTRTVSASGTPASTFRRRELLKNLSTLPLLGLFGWLAHNERQEHVDAVSGATIRVNDSSLKDLKGTLPKGKIQDHAISRLILGGNLVGGWAHARDLIYVSSLFKAYNTEKKVFETLLLAERAGINAMNVTVSMFPLINKYKKRYNSNLKTICQVYPTEEDPTAPVNQAIDYGVDIVQIQGGCADFCVRDGRIDILARCMEHAQQQGYTTGLGAHSVQTLVACQEYGLQPDFLMKTMHHDQYWSAHPKENRVPFQVDTQYSLDHDQYHDNIFCLFPEQTLDFIQQSDIPIIGFKVLAGGALKPEDGFQYAFDNGADFICVGMFDFQIVDDVNIAIAAIEKAQRRRAWMA